MTWDELERAIRKLRPDERESGDRVWIVKCCGATIGWCKRSRGRGRNKDVGPRVRGLIPKELGIPRDLWEDIAACSKSRPEYLEALGHAGHP
jgi:hypothetical protein